MKHTKSGIENKMKNNLVAGELNPYALAKNQQNTKQ